MKSPKKYIKHQTKIHLICLNPLISNIRQISINFYQNSHYIQKQESISIIISLTHKMFSGSAPIPVPSSPDAYKIIDAIRDQTDGVPTHLVFVIDIVSVRFGGYFTPQIKAYLQRFSYLQMLTLNDCGIKSLQNFPHLPGLIRLDLVFNQITGDYLSALRGSRHLQTLMLGANKIQKIQDLQSLQNMKQLLQLDLINNPVSKVPGYREKVFKIFPSITILDTLDKSGKDAYSGSSMALAVSRVPDALFDKSAPVPVYVPPPMPVPAARTKSISKIATTASTTAVVPPAPVPVPTSVPITTSASVSRVRTLSKSSSKPIIAVDSSKMKGKSGKMGKLGKTAHVTKSRSSSARAGITFPSGRIKRKLKQAMPGVRIGKGSSVYLAAVLEYLTVQLLEGAGNLTKTEKKQRITPAFLKRSLKMDEELHKLLSGVTFAMGE